MKFIRLLKNNSSDSSYLLLDKKKVNCKIGAKGIGIKTREGDFVTPKGIFSLEKVFFRADRIKKPKTSLKIKTIQRSHFWCSDPRTVNYNKLLVKKINYRCEQLYRNDSLYDIVLQTSFNSNPVKKHKGSAIFIHCSEKGKNFTEGCIALEKKELLNLLGKINRSTKLIID